MVLFLGIWFKHMSKSCTTVKFASTLFIRYPSFRLADGGYHATNGQA